MKTVAVARNRCGVDSLLWVHCIYVCTFFMCELSSCVHCINVCTVLKVCTVFYMVHFLLVFVSNVFLVYLTFVLLTVFLLNFVSYCALHFVNCISYVHSLCSGNCLLILYYILNVHCVP